MNRTSLGAHLVKPLISGRLADEHVRDEHVRELGLVLELGGDAENLRYPPPGLDRGKVFRENLRFLFNSLGRGGKTNLAVDLEVDPTTISRWLNGSYEPHSTTIQRLVSHFGLPLGTNLFEEPLFLSAEPAAMTERRQWLHSRLDGLSVDELRELYPALRRLLEER